MKYSFAFKNFSQDCEDCYTTYNFHRPHCTYDTRLINYIILVAGTYIWWQNFENNKRLLCLTLFIVRKQKTWIQSTSLHVTWSITNNNFCVRYSRFTYKYTCTWNAWWSWRRCHEAFSFFSPWSFPYFASHLSSVKESIKKHSFNLSLLFRGPFHIVYPISLV